MESQKSPAEIGLGLPVIAELLADILLQKKSIMQVLTTNILMRISIVKVVSECFLPLQESRPYTCNLPPTILFKLVDSYMIA